MKVSWQVICFFYGVLIFPAVPGWSQKLEVIFSEFREGKIVVHYSLLDSIEDRLYTVRLYASKDNFLNPLEKVSGDIGLMIKPGSDNKIIWDQNQELPAAFAGKVALEIRGTIFVPFITIKNLNHSNVYKRKKKYTLAWSGGTPESLLSFDLYHEDRKAITYPNIKNTGTFELEFPEAMKPGKNYRFRIRNSKNHEEEIFTDVFRIK